MNRYLFAPPEAPGSGIGDEAKPAVSEGKQDLADLEGVDDDSGDSDAEAGAEGEAEGDETVEGGEEGEEADEETEEDAEEAESEAEPDGDKEIKAKGPASFKAVKEKYPNLFKDFPELRSAFFLAPKFLEVFPDPEAAKDALSKADEFDSLESSLIEKGDPKLLLSTIHENNPKAFAKVADNILKTVREIDPQTYTRMAIPIVEELLYLATQHGTKRGNKNLVLACQHIADYVWQNGGEIPDVSKRSAVAEKSDAEKELEEERASHAREKFQTAASDLAKVVHVELDKVINERLDTLTAFERKQVVKETREEVERQLTKDEGLQRTLRALWKRAGDSGYSDDSKARIKRAWLDRARTVAPGIRNRLRQEALDARKGESGNGAGETKKRVIPGKGGPAQKSSSGVVDPRKIDWRKTSDLDLLK